MGVYRHPSLVSITNGSGTTEIATPEDILAFNLKRLRTSAGLSQEDLADRAGLHRTYISSVERAQRNVSLKNIFQLAKALGTEPAELLKPVSPETR